MGRFLFFLLGIFSSNAFGALAVNVPPGNEIYDLFDQLASHRCLRRTIRLIKPQTYVALRRGIFLPQGQQCNAPESLLRKTRILEPPNLRNTVGARGFFSRQDLFALPRISALVTPTYPLRAGRPTVDGGNLLLEASVAGGGGNRFGFALGATAGWAGGWVDYEKFVGQFYFQEGYLKAYYKKLEISYGRIQPEFGDAKHGTLLLSQATRPITMFRLALRPIDGIFGFDTWVGSQGDKVAVPGTRLWGLALAFHPFDWLEFGILELHQFGGNGSPQVDFANLMKMLIFSSDPGVANSVFGFHTNLWLFENYAKLYWQVMLSSVDTAWSYLVGLYLPRVSQVGLRLEFVNTAISAYQHSFWRQGLTYEHTILGHPLGPDALGIYFDLSFPLLATWEPAINLKYEERQRNPFGSAATEKRIGGGAEVRRKWTRYELSAGVRFDRVTNHQFNLGLEQNVLTALVVGKYILF